MYNVQGDYTELQNLQDTVLTKLKLINNMYINMYNCFYQSVMYLKQYTLKMFSNVWFCLR